MDTSTVDLLPLPAAPARVRLEWCGEIDMAVVPRLLVEIEHLPPCSDIELDLRGVTFIDCAGLRTIRVLRNRALIHGRQFTVTGVARQVGRIMTITGLGPLLDQRNF